MTIVPSAPPSSSLDVLSTAISAKPLLSLLFYPYGIVLRHETEAGTTDRIVSPEAVAQSLAAVQKPHSWSSGILRANTVFVGGVGSKQIVAEYRRPQMTGLYFDGSNEPVRVPMPGLILVRAVEDGKNPTYNIFAVKKRPGSTKGKLYNAPLPNNGNGGVCWGTVQHVDPKNRHHVDLTPDWQVFLGSRFGDHTTSGKSKEFPHDIRKFLLKLDAEKATTYPVDDLVESHVNLRQLFGGEA